jgi:hypothetical protein
VAQEHEPQLGRVLARGGVAADDLNAQNAAFAAAMYDFLDLEPRSSADEDADGDADGEADGDAAGDALAARAAGSPWWSSTRTGSEPKLAPADCSMWRWMSCSLS